MTKPVELTREHLRALFEEGRCRVGGHELRFSKGERERAEAVIDVALSHPRVCTCDDTPHVRGMGCW